jgi:hypothetical protein
MNDLAAASEKVLRENYANADTVGAQTEEKKSWWKFW